MPGARTPRSSPATGGSAAPEGPDEAALALRPLQEDEAHREAHRDGEHRAFHPERASGEDIGAAEPRLERAAGPKSATLIVTQPPRQSR